MLPGIDPRTPQPASASSDECLRDDLGVVEMDGDIVVYDQTRHRVHVLAGGAVLVWAALEEGETGSVAERVADRVGVPVADLAPEIDTVLAQFRDNGLLRSPAYPLSD
jgi:hypothetical protein